VGAGDVAGGRVCLLDWVTDEPSPTHRVFQRAVQDGVDEPLAGRRQPGLLEFRVQAVEDAA
jgi:hypothetical protein